MRPRLLRNKFLYVIILAAISALFFAAVQQGNKPDVKQIALTQLVQGINSGQITSIEVSEDRVTATQADGERVSSLVGGGSSVIAAICESRPVSGVSLLVALDSRVDRISFGGTVWDWHGSLLPKGCKD